MRSILIPAVLAGLVGLLACTEVHAYGAVTRTATYTNPYTGRTGTATRTTAWGPGGVERTGSVSGVGPNGAYSASGARAYSPTMYGGYSAGGVAGGYAAGGVVRVYP
jgi:hypothetical protein